MENRIPKNRYKGGINIESCKAQQGIGKADRKKQDTLSMIERAMDKQATGIAKTVTDMFRFMAMSAAMLSNIELDVDILRLKIDDGSVFFEINYPDGRKRKGRKSDSFCDEEPDDFGDGYDDDEEGLLYDGD